MKSAVSISAKTVSEAMDALALRVNWYRRRRLWVPAHLCHAFNELADACHLPNEGTWSRLMPGGKSCSH